MASVSHSSWTISGSTCLGKVGPQVISVVNTPAKLSIGGFAQIINKGHGIFYVANGNSANVHCLDVFSRTFIVCRKC